MEDIETTISDRLVTKFSDLLKEEQRKKLYQEMLPSASDKEVPVARGEINKDAHNHPRSA